MSRITIIALLVAYVTFMLPGCSSRNSSSIDMEDRLKTYIADKDARIGVAVIIDGTDTVQVDGQREFPMMSVSKFPLALAVVRWVKARGMSLADSVSFGEDAMREDTYSPMLAKYGRRGMTMTIKELLEWSLVESDNNASDILLARIGSVPGAEVMMQMMEFPEGIRIGVTEAQMHYDKYLCYLNRSTPLAMASLFYRFDSEMRDKAPSLEAIATMLVKSNTGAYRLSAPLAGTGAVVGNKTGTGPVTSQGRLMAVNDCGFVHLPNGRRYAIAVLIADSAYSLEETEKMIADISEIVYRGCRKKSDKNLRLIRRIGRISLISRILVGGMLRQPFARRAP